MPSSSAAIGLEQAAEARLAFKLLDAFNQWRPVGIVLADPPIANSLMRPAVVVVVDELSHDVIKMCQAKDDKGIEGFVLQTLDPPRC